MTAQRSDEFSHFSHIAARVVTARAGKERDEKMTREGKLKCEAMFAGNLIDVRLWDSKGSKSGARGEQSG